MSSKLIYQQIPKVMDELKPIGKNKTNTSQKFKYRGIDDFYNELQPLLAKHKLFTMPEVLESVREEKKASSGAILIYRVLKIKYTVYAEDGSNVSGIIQGEAMDPGDKAGNKAMSIGHKYFLAQLFCVPTDDLSDPDSESHNITSNNTGITESALSDKIKSSRSLEDLAKIGLETKGKLGHFSTVQNDRINKCIIEKKIELGKSNVNNEDVPF